MTIVCGQLASFYWVQFASSLVKAGFSGDQNLDARVETKGGGSHRWLTPQRGSENYVAIVPINGSKLESHQCRGRRPVFADQKAAACPKGWKLCEIPDAEYLSL